MTDVLTDTNAAVGPTWVVDPERSTVGFNIAACSSTGELDRRPLRHR